MAHPLPLTESPLTGHQMPKRSHHKKPDPHTATRSGAEAAEGMHATPDSPTIEHESGYGGKHGAPRVSSDKREKVERDGSLRSERK